MDSRRVKTIGLASTILVLIVSSVSSAQADYCVKEGVHVFTRPLPEGKVVVDKVPRETNVSFGRDEEKRGTVLWRYVQDADPSHQNDGNTNKRIGWIPWNRDYVTTCPPPPPPRDFVPAGGGW